MTGTVKTLPPGKSFGFILAEGQDYFFHATDVEHKGFTELRIGDVVSFEVVANPKGPRAARVRKTT